MSITFAVDALYSAGWSTLDSTGCEVSPDGRVYPGPGRVRHELDALGLGLTIGKVEEFDCVRAEWTRSGSSTPEGAVVGQTEAEAAVYALAQARRSLSHSPA
ncbi:MAG TPA: hypothetical protein DEB06_08335 [Phycisphaerales bacterium]|nr:hypothetical protein [Phycisphaerales bacterium]